MLRAISAVHHPPFFLRPVARSRALSAGARGGARRRFFGVRVHLPWTQIENDAIEKGEALGRFLGVEPAAGIGLLVLIHRFALRRAPDRDFSGCLRDPDPGGLLAAALGLAPRKGPILWRSLVRLELAEGVKNEGRIRGLDRYARAWEKNRPKSARLTPEDRRETGGRPAENRPETGAPESESDAESEETTSLALASLPDRRSEGEDSRDYLKALDDANAFFNYALEQAPPIGTPGPTIHGWAIGFFRKYPSSNDAEAIRRAFVAFLVWCETSPKPKRIGWGLWIAEDVWFERFNTARAALRARIA
jgi:hypothetical protein